MIAAAFLALAGGAHAQEPMTTGAMPSTWKPGATLAVPGASGKPGTLAFEAKSNERDYAIQNTNMTLSLKLLRLSGEREVPLKISELNAQKNVFDGTMGSVKFWAVDDKNAIVEYKTAEKVQGLAFAELRSSASETSATVSQKMGVRVIDSKQAVDLLFEGAPRSFREQVPDGYRVVVPIESGQKITLKLSISDFTGPLVKPTPAMTMVPTPEPTLMETDAAAGAAAAASPAMAAGSQPMTPTVIPPTPGNSPAPTAVVSPTIGGGILATPVPVDPAPAPGSRRGPAQR
ncbi:MAG: hypothetical protein ABI579_00085 [Candidatus Sumerlaeota bacterium]